MTAFLVAAALFVLAVLGALTYLRRVWFFRDPVRVPPVEPGLVVSPADGRVVYLRRVEGGEVWSEKLGRAIRVREILRDEWSADGWLLGIYMSPLDVHYNYAPIEGVVERVVHTSAARNWPMVDLWEYVRLTYLRRAVDLFAHRFHLENERNTVFLRGTGPADGIRLALVEIADLYVNKIECRVEPGQTVRCGEKLSFIRRGSQVDVYFDRPDVEFLVRVGQQVYGAKTPLARVAGQAAGGGPC
ncbi:MAG: phosphatidylserine decarboxylase [Clostridia bacterium]|nr:phosphatidylserine decarboxylase [Clostridia bacterium]